MPSRERELSRDKIRREREILLQGKEKAGQEQQVKDLRDRYRAPSAGKGSSRGNGRPVWWGS